MTIKLVLVCCCIITLVSGAAPPPPPGPRSVTAATKHILNQEKPRSSSSSSGSGSLASQLQGRSRRLRKGVKTRVTLPPGSPATDVCHLNQGGEPRTPAQYKLAMNSPPTGNTLYATLGGSHKDHKGPRQVSHAWEMEFNSEHTTLQIPRNEAGDITNRLPPWTMVNPKLDFETPPIQEMKSKIFYSNDKATDHLECIRRKARIEDYRAAQYHVVVSTPSAQRVWENLVIIWHAMNDALMTLVYPGGMDAQMNSPITGFPARSTDVDAPVDNYKYHVIGLRHKPYKVSDEAAHFKTGFEFRLLIDHASTKLFTEWAINAFKSLRADGTVAAGNLMSKWKFTDMKQYHEATLRHSRPVTCNRDVMKEFAERVVGRDIPDFALDGKGEKAFLWAQWLVCRDWNRIFPGSNYPSPASFESVKWKTDPMPTNGPKYHDQVTTRFKILQKLFGGLDGVQLMN